MSLDSIAAIAMMVALDLGVAIVPDNSIPDSVRERLAGLGAEVASGDSTSPRYLGQLVKSEIEKWATPIKASGVIVE